MYKIQKTCLIHEWLVKTVRHTQYHKPIQCSIVERNIVLYAFKIRLSLIYREHMTKRKEKKLPDEDMQIN